MYLSLRRFRFESVDEKKLCAYAGLVPSTYALGGKVFHGRITKTGNKWLRRAFIEIVQPAISCDPTSLPITSYSR